MLAWQEYLCLLNPGGKHHPSDAYRVSLTEGGSLRAHGGKERFPVLLNTVERRGLRFEIRLGADDRYTGRYAKLDPATGEVLRGPDGQALVATGEEEIAGRIPPGSRYEYSVGIFSPLHGLVGVVCDEWGCVLVRVADEYRGFGFGRMLTDLAYALEPGKTTGGLTAGGEAVLRHQHGMAVSRMLASGGYSRMAAEGRIEARRAKEIVASALLPRQAPERGPLPSLDFADSSAWMLYAGGYGDFVVYNRSLPGLIAEDDGSGFWPEQAVLGLAYAAAHDDGRCRIKAFGAARPEIARLLLLLSADHARREGCTLWVEPDELDLCRSMPTRIRVSGKESYAPGYRASPVVLACEPPDVTGLLEHESVWRSRFDTYGEFRDRMVEMAYARFRHDAPEPQAGQRIR
jgi:hypothetical protein